MSSITSLFSSLFSSEPIYNDSENAAPEPEKEEPEQEEAAEEEEEEEPEDVRCPLWRAVGGGILRSTVI